MVHRYTTPKWPFLELEFLSIPLAFEFLCLTTRTMDNNLFFFFSSLSLCYLRLGKGGLAHHQIKYLSLGFFSSHLYSLQDHKPRGGQLSRLSV